MNIAEYAIRKKVVTIVLSVLVLLAGTIAYVNISRLEDPEFTIKKALIITRYPGASAEQVAEEVTEKLEKAIQQMGQLKRVTSRSMRGESIITAEMQDKYDKHTLPQVWDELRRKINDAQASLPTGAGPSVIQDDYGDVYGMFFALTGADYSMAELKEVAKFLQRELLHCRDVKKIVLWGVRDEAVYVEMSREKMAALGISPQQIFTLLAQKNLIADAGKVKVGSEYLPITPTGGITRFDDLGKMLISKDDDRIICLRDVAAIKRDYSDPPDCILTYNGQPAIGIAASTVLGGNTVVMGDAIMQRAQELKSQLPLGVKLNPISLQSEAVKTAINNFVLNVIESLVIVVVVLLVFMG
ncbi:MAG: efflux RND transporter permease subunit, partial [Victivallales bacterium]|nr:efflux RND transporter permease subunit [Victivallales bacterium]